MLLGQTVSTGMAAEWRAVTALSCDRGMEANLVPSMPTRQRAPRGACRLGTC